MALKLTDEHRELLIQIKNELMRGDKDARDSSVRDAKQLEYYWRGFQNVFWDEAKMHWRIPTHVDEAKLREENGDAVADKIINIYRAYGESIIAALSTGLPTTRYFPDDAESAADISTSKAFSRIGEKIEADNKGSLLFTRAISILYGNPFVAAYNYHDTGKQYGETKIAKYEDQPVTEQFDACGQCGMEYTQSPCPACGFDGPPAIGNRETGEVESVLTGWDLIPKSQEVIEIYGVAHVAIPFHIKKLRDASYLCLSFEQDEALIWETYPELRVEGSPDDTENNRDGRNVNSYDNDRLVTVSKTWIRSWGFNAVLNTFDDESDVAIMVKELKQEFPNGLLLIDINGKFADAIPESMDDHWAIAENPTSDTLYSVPIGRTVAPIQEMRTEIDNLALDTIRHSLPETFVDPAVLDLQAYGKMAGTPGLTTPAKPKAGMSLSDAFFEKRTATISEQLGTFQSKLDADAQFVSGAYPSVFGGVQTGGSNTAKEYEMSRNAALQRLSILWKMLCNWWPDVMKNSVSSYVKTIKETSQDVRFPKRTGTGFANVWVRRAELTGTVGQVISDTSDQLPISWSQKRGMMTDLLSMGLDPLAAMIFSPENIEMVNSVLAFPEMHVPGETDKNKQLFEISELIKAEPIYPPPPTMDPLQMQDPEMVNMLPPGMGEMLGQPPMEQMPPQPSVPIDPDLDDHQMHMIVLKNWLNGEEARDLKQSNPAGYENVYAHFMAHKQYLDDQMVQQQQAQMMGVPGEEPPIGIENGTEPPPPSNGEI